MNQVGIGISKETDPNLAISEVIESAVIQANLPEVNWILIFFTTDHFVHAGLIHELILEKTNCKSIAGCSGLGVLCQNEEITNGPGIVLMAGYTPALKTLALAKFQELEHSMGVTQQLCEALEELKEENSLFLFFPDVFSHQPHNFINMFNFLKNKPKVFGGGSCNNGNQQTSIQFGPEIITLNGAGGLAFEGIPKFCAGVTQSCETFGEPMFVTEVKDDIIVSLDGIPALEVFTEVAKELGANDIEDAAKQLLLSFPLDPLNPVFTGERAMARHITGIDVTSQGIITSEIVHEGGVLSFAYRNQKSAEKDLKLMLNRLKEQNIEIPTFGIYFNCASRGEALYGRPNVDVDFIREILGEFPLVGFFGAYEMAQMPQGVQLYSYTGVLVLIYL
mgnify:CR=1 FL=1